MKTLLLAFALLPALAFGAEKDACQERGFDVKGNVREIVALYDKFALSLQGKKNPFAEVQAYLAKNGLPFSADIEKGGVKKSLILGWMEMDSTGDPEAIVFVKKLKAPAKSGVKFDKVYLFESGSAKKALHIWNVPFNSFYPAGLIGDELIFHTSIYGYCRETQSVEITLAIKPDGTFRALDWPKDAKLKEVPEQKCQAKKFFKGSDYTSCSEILDSKSKKNRVIVWEQPMT
jgi:hypothetical protein